MPKNYKTPIQQALCFMMLSFLIAVKFTISLWNKWRKVPSFFDFSKIEKGRFTPTLFFIFLLSFHQIPNIIITYFFKLYIFCLHTQAKTRARGFVPVPLFSFEIKKLLSHFSLPFQIYRLLVKSFLVKLFLKFYKIFINHPLPQ